MSIFFTEDIAIYIYIYIHIYIYIYIYVSTTVCIYTRYRRKRESNGEAYTYIIDATARKEKGFTEADDAANFQRRNVLFINKVLHTVMWSFRCFFLLGIEPRHPACLAVGLQVTVPLRIAGASTNNFAGLLCPVT